MPITDKYGLTKDQKGDLIEILSYKRPDRSCTENEMINKFIRPLSVHQDKFGNLWKVVGSGQPRVCFSSHTDTVHNKAGRQEVGIYKESNTLCVLRENKTTCLGADDGAGIWIMRNMILEGIPGMYVFHRGEERGGRGSSWVEKNQGYLFASVKICIAFDRKDKDNIITHQGGSRCCSEEFAKSLRGQLEKNTSWGWKPDPTGSFTDSANYTGIIAECTNLSVGYYAQHSKRETLCLRQLYPIYWALLNVDWNALTVSRKPGEKEYRTYEIPYSTGSNYWTNKARRNGKNHTRPMAHIKDRWDSYYCSSKYHVWQPDICVWVLKDQYYWGTNGEICTKTELELEIETEYNKKWEHDLDCTCTECLPDSDIPDYAPNSREVPLQDGNSLDYVPRLPQKGHFRYF